MKQNNIGFIGAGNMASALLGGLVQDGCKPERLWVSDPDAAKLQLLSSRLGVHTHQDNLAIIEQAHVVVLAVKPQVVHQVLQPLAAALKKRRPLIVSVAAGIRCDSLQTWLDPSLAIVRAMPNTPAMVQSGATALYANANVSTEQHQLAESIMRAVGLALWVPDEAQLDVVTALSGSGPAYYFLVMEAMQKAGMELGLDEKTARLLTLQTAFGAAKLALEAEDSPRQLRARVTSPGGTTEQAIKVMQEQQLEAIFARGIQAACTRSKQLAEQLASN